MTRAASSHVGHDFSRVPVHPPTVADSPSEVPSVVGEVLSSPGEPLDAAARVFMEPRFGHDFSRVRVHADAKAAESARSVRALAYTVGNDVVFGAGQYAPGASAGRHLLAHELAHVVQQTGSLSGGNRAEPEGIIQRWRRDWAPLYDDSGTPSPRNFHRVCHEVRPASPPQEPYNSIERRVESVFRRFTPTIEPQFVIPTATPAAYQRYRWCNSGACPNPDFIVPRGSNVDVYDVKPVGRGARFRDYLRWGEHVCGLPSDQPLNWPPAPSLPPPSPTGVWRLGAEFPGNPYVARRENSLLIVVDANLWINVFQPRNGGTIWYIQHPGPLLDPSGPIDGYTVNRQPGATSDGVVFYYPSGQNQPNNPTPAPGSPAGAPTGTGSAAAGANAPAAAQQPAPPAQQSARLPADPNAWPGTVSLGNPGVMLLPIARATLPSLNETAGFGNAAQHIVRGGYRISPHVRLPLTDNPRVVYYTAQHLSRRVIEYAIGPADLDNFLEHIDVYENYAGLMMMYLQNPHDVSSAQATYLLMRGDIRRGLAAIGRAWSEAFHNPMWVMGAIVSTASPFTGSGAAAGRGLAGEGAATTGVRVQAVPPAAAGAVGVEGMSVGAGGSAGAGMTHNR
ncbi:MAG: DUF4157 domain-containing protein [Pyrinomonadaceae bacterium]